METNPKVTNVWVTLHQSWHKVSGEIQPGNIWIDAYVGINSAKQRLVLCDIKKCIRTGLVIVDPVTIESLGTLLLPLPSGSPADSFEIKTVESQ